MKVVAVLPLRNEQLYIERLLHHLRAQGILVWILDNGSADRTISIARRHMNDPVLAIEPLPYPGYYPLGEVLHRLERIAPQSAADWLILLGADEILESPLPGTTLAGAIRAADADGYNVVEFNEFVFVPTAESESYEGRDYVAEMQHYYFHRPRPLIQLRCWKATCSAKVTRTGGHLAEFPGRRLYPIPFVMRHYIFLSKGHGIRKYGQERRYDRREVELLKWHRDRVHFSPEKLRLPAPASLKRLRYPGVWDRSSPESSHALIGLCASHGQP